MEQNLKDILASNFCGDSGVNQAERETGGCFANSVRLAYFLLHNVSLCCVYRCLKVPSVSLM